MKSSSRNRGGRPRKFREPSRPITITLPDRILHLLDALGPDRARAIVRAVDQQHPAWPASATPVETVEVAKGLGIIVVTPSARLRRIKGLRLIEVAPQRYLLALLEGLTANGLEVLLADILDEEPKLEARERDLIAQLHAHLRQLRRSEKVSRAEILFVAI